MNCSECGGKCCYFLPLAQFTTPDALRTAGVAMNPKALLYLSLRKGITIRGNRLFVDADTPLVAYDGRLGKTWLAAAPCRWLEHGRCAHYEQRPPECRAFDASTAAKYFVPVGCKYDDERHLGEDFSEVTKLAKEGKPCAMTP